MTRPAGRRALVTPLERGNVSVAWRPQLVHPVRRDWLSGAWAPRWPGDPGADVERDLRRRPHVLREQAYGHQRPDGSWRYAQAPRRSEEAGGTARGGAFVCLPGQGLTDIEDRPDLEAFRTYAPRVWRAYGWPDVLTGGCLEGSYRSGYDPDTGALVVAARQEGGSWADLWMVETSFGDLLPGRPDQFVGGEDYPVRGVAVGDVSGDPDAPGIEGVVMERSDTDQGGVLLAGFRNEPVRSGSPGTEANAPAELSGEPLLLMSRAGVVIQAPDTWTEDHYLIAGPTQTLSDGRIVTPVLRGPQVIYATEQEATDSRDVELNQVSEEQIVSMTLTDDYPLGSQYYWQVNLSEEGGRAAYVDLVFRVNGLETGRGTYAVSGNVVLVTEQDDIDAPLTTGDVVSMHAVYTGTHPQNDVWVRGTLQPSVLRVRHIA